MKDIIETLAIKEGQFFEGCFTFRLKNPIDGRKFGVINYETVGRCKLGVSKTGDYLSIEAIYKKGPDAILIKEIL